MERTMDDREKSQLTWYCLIIYRGHFLISLSEKITAIYNDRSQLLILEYSSMSNVT